MKKLTVGSGIWYYCFGKMAVQMIALSMQIEGEESPDTRPRSATIKDKRTRLTACCRKTRGAISDALGRKSVQSLKRREEPHPDVDGSIPP
jgi:hypothetical protein